MHEAADPSDLEALVDLVLPELPPYEFAIYLLLLRLTEFEGGELRVGKRRIAKLFGKGTTGSRPSYAHVSTKLDALEAGGFIQSTNDTNREGTLYKITAVANLPAVRAARTTAPSSDLDYFTDPELRTQLYERDAWRCEYCGETVSPDNATLDHVVPRSLGGGNEAENLVTACLPCNSIKADRTYEDAAPDILKALKSRQRR